MPRTLYIIDAFAQIFRAYFAIRGGMNSPVTSEPTQAVFGVTAMLLKLLQQYKPEYVLVAIDAPGKTFRDELFEEYKATRSPTPDDLIAQIDRVFEVVDAFGIPMLKMSGLEADDVMACIATQVCADPEAADVQVRLVSKDKDLEQLLSDRISMFDIHTDATIDVAALYANKGIRPDQVIDYLTMTGDSVDNVPGVEGIGPKTASQLLQEFGSLDGIYENIDKIKGKRRENLEKALGHIALSRELVTLKCDVDLNFGLADAKLRPLQLSKLLPLFQQLGFNRFQDEVRRLAGEAAPPAVATAAAPGGTLTLDMDEPTEVKELATADVTGYRAVTTLADLEELVATLGSQPMVSVDTETTGLERDARLCGISLAWKPGKGVYVPVLSPDPGTHLDTATVLSVLGPVLEDASIPKCGHNLKFDSRVLLRNGVRLRGVIFDSMLASTVLDPRQGNAKLDNLAESLLSYRMIPISSLISDGPEQISIDMAPLDQVVPYAAEDADIALRLYHILMPRLQEAGMTGLLQEVEAPLAVVISEMEENGICCDGEELVRQGEAMKGRVEELRQAIYAAAGFEFDLNSTKQLAEALFDRLGLKAGKKTKTGRSTDIEVLEKLASEEDRADPKTSVPRLIIEYRQLTKLISTYLGNLRDAIGTDGRIHTTFHQLVTATGRLASHGPNLQNIPIRTEIGRQIRKAFHAPAEHCLIAADYSQIELRMLAHLSGDEALVQAFQNDDDIHTTVASQVFGVPPEQVTREMRSHAKTINFGIIYGVTSFGLARRVEGLDRAGATQLIADYKRRYAGIDTFLQRCVQQATADGYVTTLLGRRRYIPEVQSSNGQHRALGERLAINSVVQGSAADLIKIAMVRVQNRIDRERLPMRLLLQIHDELVLEAPREAAAECAEAVKHEMEGAMSLNVPLRAEAGIGFDWMSAK